MRNFTLGLMLFLWAARAALGVVTNESDINHVAAQDKICFALYTVHNRILKLNTQLYPLGDEDSRVARLEIHRNGAWKQIAEAKVIDDGWTALFRVENWDHSKDTPYRVLHGDKASFEGTIKKDASDKDVITVAAFTGNSVHKAHGGDIARTDIVDNIKRIQPDLLFFSGDQVYNHTEHLTFWLKFGRDFGEIIKDIPTVTIPDDHDVGQPNLWGEEGKRALAPGADDGGYLMPPKYVRMVERAQTSHLPDPYDPAPIKRGIGVYYTALNVGGIDFAIIEDRKFKTGPAGIVPQMGPRPDHIDDPNYDPKTIDLPEAKLLGDRQLAFLRDWSANWTNAEMKTVLSQTIFCGGAHIHGKIGGRLHADMDSNGWPQAGRNRALREMRKGFAFMLAGDQHLGSVFHHGVNDWGDAGYSFCVPSIANLYLRWWAPLEPGKNRQPGAPEYTGQHYDGFGNKLTVHAVANPDQEPSDGQHLTTRAAGFGVVKFNKSTREITMECWPRNVDITDPGNKPYPGWPVTIHQEDNYGRKPIAWLPTLKVTGQTNPVVQVIDEFDHEIVYTIRINGDTWRPKVFREGPYTLHIGEGDARKTLTGVRSLTEKAEDVLVIAF